MGSYCRSLLLGFVFVFFVFSFGVGGGKKESGVKTLCFVQEDNKQQKPSIS